MTNYPPPDLNPNCVCPNPMAQMFCPYGHMTECHYPYTCEEAECSHYHRQLDDDNNDVFTPVPLEDGFDYDDQPEANDDVLP